MQRTQWGLPPAFPAADADGTRFLRVPLQTYNPNAAYTGKEMYACGLASRTRWNVGAGLEYETRIRSNKLPTGLVLGYFGYADAGIWQSTYQKTETDFEFLTSQASDSIWLNIWDDWNPLRGGPNSATLTSIPGLNWNGGTWNVYKIRWFPTYTEWWVNGKCVRTETTVQPGAAMSVRFNLWAATDWFMAADLNLKATSDPNNFETYFYDVDYVRVRPIVSTNSAFWGNGTGLTGNYYDNTDFTGTRVTRRDPRIDFGWGVYSPDPALEADYFSARWTGQIQAQYTQDYTFYARTDDGVRVWINNQLVIDNWVDQSPTEVSSSPIRLTAGAKVPIRVEYLENTGGADAQLFWSSPSTPKQLVPQSQLYPENVVATPVFSPVPGTYGGPLSVAISSSTPGATIRYTLDNSDPTPLSPALSSGGTISLTASKTVLARAFLDGWAASDLKAGNYTIVPDTTKPVISIASPLSGALLRGFSTSNGSTSDVGGSGVKKVAFVLRRVSDAACWNGSAWVSGDFGMPITFSGSAWSCAGPFPTGSSLPDGVYVLKAIAWDNAGNYGTANTPVTIDKSPPSVAITSHAANATITQLTTVSGSASDNAGGTGIGKVEFTIIRGNDGTHWNGSSWVKAIVGIPTTFSGNRWTISDGSPTAAKMPSGSLFPGLRPRWKLPLHADADNQGFGSGCRFSQAVLGSARACPDAPSR